MRQLLCAIALSEMAGGRHIPREPKLPPGRRHHSIYFLHSPGNPSPRYRQLTRARDGTHLHHPFPALTLTSAIIGTLRGSGISPKTPFHSLPPAATIS